MQLRPYQAQTLQEIRQSLALKERGAIVKLSTGAGKTAIFCTILAGYHKANRPAMMLVRGVKLVEQASERLTAMGVPHDIWQGAATVRSGHKVIIASVDTLVARCMPKEGKNHQALPEAEILIVDEVHLARSPGFDWVIGQYPASYLAGFSATPNHPRGFDDIADRLICPIGIKELIEQGYLVGGKYFIPDIPDLEGVKKTGGDFNEKQLAEVMIDGRKTHNAAKVWDENCRGKPTLVYACTVAHAAALWEAFREVGAKAQVLVGDTQKEVRNQAILELEQGTLDAIISVGVLTTGVDIPALRAIICARPTESYNLWVQILGRGTRTFQGKTHFDVYDLAGNIVTHGTIEDEKESYLNAQEAKKAKKEKNGKVIAICQKCYATFEFSGQNQCVSCGADLVHLRKKKVGKRISTIGEMSDVKEYVKQEWEYYFDEVLKKALDKGWKKGSVFYKMEERFGSTIAEKAFNKIKGRRNWPKRA
jgi:DNA repair protein RadD